MLRWENEFSQDAFNVVPRLEKDEAFLNPPAAQNMGFAAAMAAGAGMVTSSFGASQKKPSANVQEFGTSSGATEIGNMSSGTTSALGGQS